MVTSDAHVIILVDRSGSMLGNGRIEAAQYVVSECERLLLRDSKSTGSNLLFEVFGYEENVIQLERAAHGNGPAFKLDAVAGALSELGAGLAAAAARFAEVQSRTPVLLLVTDGPPTENVDPSSSAAVAHLSALAGLVVAVLFVDRSGAESVSGSFFDAVGERMFHEPTAAISVLRNAVSQGASV